MSKPTFEICIDWDTVNWADVPDFSESYDNITSDIEEDGIIGLSWSRGKQREEGNAPAATLVIEMKRGLCQKYSPFTANADLVGKIRPWLPVRLRVTHNGSTYTKFTGFISSISYNPALSAQTVTFYCTDGTDLLARQLITQNTTSRTFCSDGEAIHKILDAAGWSRDKRDINMDGGEDLLAYPSSTAY